MASDNSYKGWSISFDTRDFVKTLKKSEKAITKAKKVVSKYSTKVAQRMAKSVPVDTGYLRRSIQPPTFTDNGMTGVVKVNAEYSQYVEYGTRYMSAQPYMQPSLDSIEQSFYNDLQGIVKEFN